MQKREKTNTKAIEAAIAGLETRFKEKVVLKMGDSSTTNVSTTSSGRPDLDAILGGGYPDGKIIEIFAEEATGKTGLALEAIKAVQDLGGNAAIIDAEHALNTAYCEQIGIDLGSLYISQPSFGEQAIETIRTLAATGQFDLIVVDSVAAMVPRAELEGESGESKMGLQARLMSQGMKLITGACSNTGCTVIFINQLRDTMAMYGPSQTTTGGKALKFYAAQRLELKKKGWIKEGEEVIGFTQEVRVVKNKIAPPFKKILNDIIYGKGVDQLTGIIEACLTKGVIVKKGAWFSYEDTNIAQGMAKLRVMLEDNPELVEELVLQL